MDVGLPLRSVTPGVEADVLSVLLRTHAPLTGNRVARLSGRSYSQVRSVLHRLVTTGLVDAEPHGRAVSYSLNRAHVLVPGLERLADARTEVDRRIRDLVTGWSDPAPVVAVFGSYARHNGTTDSDIDILLIRPDDADESAWEHRRHVLAEAVERWTGNPAQILDLSAAELADAVAEEEPLIAELRAHAVALTGKATLAKLLSGAPTSAESR